MKPYYAFRALGADEPLFNMNSGRLQASLDRVEAILTHPSWFVSEKKVELPILVIYFGHLISYRISMEHKCHLLFIFFPTSMTILLVLWSYYLLLLAYDISIFFVLAQH